MGNICFLELFLTKNTDYKFTCKIYKVQKETNSRVYYCDNVGTLTINDFLDYDEINKIEIRRKGKILIATGVCFEKDVDKFKEDIKQKVDNYLEKNSNNIENIKKTINILECEDEIRFT